MARVRAIGLLSPFFFFLFSSRTSWANAARQCALANWDFLTACMKQISSVAAGAPRVPVCPSLPSLFFFLFFFSQNCQAHCLAALPMTSCDLGFIDLGARALADEAINTALRLPAAPLFSSLSLSFFFFFFPFYLKASMDRLGRVN